MEMEEDTFIALGFVAGAVLLVVIILIWVIIYCLCCRKREEAQNETPEKTTRQPVEQFRYLSNESTQSTNHTEGSISVSSSQSGRSYQRQLPQLPHKNNPESSRSAVRTPEYSGEATPKGISNQGFISSKDSMYAYCSDIPRYPAPDAPQHRNQSNHHHQPSNELLFLEKKYNIKADDTDDVCNSRPLTCYSSTSSAYSPTAGQNTEQYADVNNLLRSFSIHSSKENEALHKEKSSYKDTAAKMELNQNQNASLPDFDCENLKPNPGGDALPLDITKDVGNRVVIDSRSATIERRSQLKEIEEISFDAQNISPECALVKSPYGMDVADNMTYFSTSELSEGKMLNSEVPNSDSECGRGIASKAAGPAKPVPKPRYSRSASISTLISQGDDACDVCNDYTNIPPLPMPRTSQPATIERLDRPMPELQRY